MFDRINITKIAKQTCEDMTAEDRQNMGYATLEECTVGMRKQIWGSIVAVMIFVVAVWVFITVHWCMVLYQHAKNSTLPKEEGGTGEDPMDIRDEA